MIKIYWYRHPMENRNDLLRFGLMRLHLAKEIIYIEQDISQAFLAGFSKKISSDKHNHLSFLSLENKSRSTKIIVDNEDSFIHCSPYLKEADYYFTAAYSSDFYKNKTFPKVYNWQKEDDINWYQSESSSIIKRLSEHFYKVKPFIPIAPNLTSSEKKNRFNQGMINAANKMTKFFKNRNYWRPALNDFEKRYNTIRSLRNNGLKYDVILSDTLWGWPKHRIKLHRKLAKLSVTYSINAILNWHPPYIHDGSMNAKIDNRDFPMHSGEVITNYEKMLSESKLGTFATGFHWGWRNIMTFSLCIGIPVVMDKPIFEPYFDFNKFKVFYNEDGEWNDIRPLLDKITPEYWEQIKTHNQLIYDQYLAPEAVARYLIKTIT